MQMTSSPDLTIAAPQSAFNTFVNLVDHMLVLNPGKTKSIQPITMIQTSHCHGFLHFKNVCVSEFTSVCFCLNCL